MCEEACGGGLFVDVPDDYALVVTATHEGLAIPRDAESSDPALVTGEGSFTVSCGDFP